MYPHTLLFAQALRAASRPQHPENAPRLRAAWRPGSLPLGSPLPAESPRLCACACALTPCAPPHTATGRLPGPLAPWNEVRHAWAFSCPVTRVHASVCICLRQICIFLPLVTSMYSFSLSREGDWGGQSGCVCVCVCELHPRGLTGNVRESSCPHPAALTQLPSPSSQGSRLALWPAGGVRDSASFRGDLVPSETL